MTEPSEHDAAPAFLLSRRALLRRAAMVGAALPAAGGLLDAFAGGAGAAVDETGTIVLNNYPGWMGAHVIASFQKRFPGAKVKMVTNATSSAAEVVLQFKSGNYDFLLADTTDCAQASAAHVVQSLDWSKIPNVKNVS